VSLLGESLNHSICKENTMARRTSIHPTDLELEILQVLWRSGPSTVTNIRKGLAPVRVLAPTSVHTLMTIMLRKGYIKKQQRSRGVGGSLFRAAVTQQNIAGKMIKQIVSRFFGGSTCALMQNLLTSGEVNASDLAELKDLVNKQGSKTKR
jgi:BlaI family transcriptional regulator, penicillinase repressor